VFFLFIVVLGCKRTPDNFKAFLLKLIDVPMGQRQRSMDKWMHGKQLPIIEREQVYFIYRNIKDIPVFLTGDMNGWQKETIPFLKIIGTDYYYCEQHYNSKTRLEYKFIVDNKWILDSLNVEKSLGGYGENSLLFMPDYEYSPYILQDRQKSYTELDSSKFNSPTMSGVYDTWFYRNIQADSSSPLLIFNDGGDYLKYAYTAIVLDNLIRENKIPSCQALFLQPKKRMKEYWLNKKFTQMIFNEYLPWAERKYKIDKIAQRYIGGASLGGLCAFYALGTGKLNGAFAQSPSFWVDSVKIIDQLRTAHIDKQKLYFDFGTLEKQDNVQNTMIAFLESKNAQFKYNTWPEGHNWGNWRGHLDRALIYLLNPNGTAPPISRD